MTRVLCKQCHERGLVTEHKFSKYIENIRRYQSDQMYCGTCNEMAEVVFISECSPKIETELLKDLKEIEAKQREAWKKYWKERVTSLQKLPPLRQRSREV